MRAVVSDWPKSHKEATGSAIDLEEKERGK